jgi:hypothetical protein
MSSVEPSSGSSAEVPASSDTAVRDLAASEAELVSDNRLTTLEEADGRKKVGVIGFAGILALYLIVNAAAPGGAASVPPVIFSLLFSAFFAVFGTGLFSV